MRKLVYYNEILTHCDCCGRSGPSWVSGFTTNDLKLRCPNCNGQLRHRLWQVDTKQPSEEAGWKSHDMEFTKYLMICAKENL